MFNQLEILSDEQSEKLYTIRRYIKNLDSVCIAYSGGVDSTLVASLAFEQLGRKAIAITGISPALANTLREEAKRQAKKAGADVVKSTAKRAKSAWQKYMANPKKQIRFKTGKRKGRLDLKRMSTAYKREMRKKGRK